MKKLLEQSIVRTLTYFDIIKKPLTAEELFYFLWQPPFIGKDEFEKILDENSAGVWQVKDGLYFLRSREELAAARVAGLAHSGRLLKIAARAAKKIRSVPFLRAILVCNSVGSQTANENSDVDFFVVAASGRAWIVRFFSNIILLLFGLRRRGKHIAGKVCLSFTVDEKNLNMASWRVCDDDIHFAYWLYQMIPMYDPNNFYEKLLVANSWTRKYLPNIDSAVRPLYCHSRESGNPVVGQRLERLDPRLRGDDSECKVGDSTLGLKWKKLWEKFWTGGYGNFIEHQARALQQSKMKFSSHGKIRPHDKSVITGEGIIKLHETDPRERIHRQWLDAISKQE